MNQAIQGTCCHERYLDALSISAIVLPRDPINPAKPAKRMTSGFSPFNAKPGDGVAAWTPSQSTFTLLWWAIMAMRTNQGDSRADSQPGAGITA
jgi:hypothetical protein